MERVVKRRFFGFFQKAGRGRGVNGTRACIHAEIMEIDGDDLRGKARRTGGNGGKGGRKGLEGRNLPEI